MKNNSELREGKFAMIRRWEESGLSQKKFVEKERILFPHFYYWLKKYRDQGKKSVGKFIKLKTTDRTIPSNVITEVVFANGNRIKFHNAIEISQLKQLAG